MQNVHGSLKINELKLQGTEGVDFKLKVQADELHIKRGNTSLLTVSMDANSVLTGVTPSGSDKITINAPVKFNKGVSYEDTHTHTHIHMLERIGARTRFLLLHPFPSI